MIRFIFSIVTRAHRMNDFWRPRCFIPSKEWLNRYRKHEPSEWCIELNFMWFRFAVEIW